MPQNTVLPDWRATYPIDAPAMKPGGTEVRKAVAISASSWAGSVATYTVAAHGLPLGSGAVVTVMGVTPAGYNGTFNANITTATAFTVAMPTTPGGAGTAFGTAYYMNLASTAIPNAELFSKPLAVGSAEYTKMLADLEAAKSGKPPKEAAEEEDEEESEEEGEEEEGEEEGEEEESEKPTPRRPRRR